MTEQSFLEQEKKKLYEQAEKIQSANMAGRADCTEPVQEWFTSRVENQIRRNILRNRNNEKMQEFMFLLGEDQKLRRLFDLYDAIRSEV